MTREFKAMTVNEVEALVLEIREQQLSIQESIYEVAAGGPGRPGALSNLNGWMTGLSNALEGVLGSESEQVGEYAPKSDKEVEELVTGMRTNLVLVDQLIHNSRVFRDDRVDYYEGSKTGLENALEPILSFCMKSMKKTEESNG